MRRALGLLALSSLTFVQACNESFEVRVELDEFTVKMSPASVYARPWAFRIDNTGTVPHSFLLVRTELKSADLPLRDGEIDLESKSLKFVAATPLPSKPGDEVAVTAEDDLVPGRYVAACSVPGHYQSGMHAPFEVTGRP